MELGVLFLLALTPAAVSGAADAAGVGRDTSAAAEQELPNYCRLRLLVLMLILLVEVLSATQFLWLLRLLVLMLILLVEVLSAIQFLWLLRLLDWASCCLR